MKKQLLFLVMTLLPMAASADAVEIDGIYYNLVSKVKTAEVTSNPSKYTGAVEIPSSVTYEDVTYSVTSIGDGAFRGCSGLTSVTIPNSVTSIGVSAFYGCSGLTSVTIPNSVTSIRSYAFQYCYGLTSVTIGNSVTSIDWYAFSGCSGLTSVTIPNSVTSIGNYAFYKCGLTSITIPNSVTSIGDYALYECSKLVTITIGSGIKSIGNSAFATCPELVDVYCYAENVPTTNGTAFNDSYIEYATLHVPEEAIEDYGKVEPWNGFKNIIAVLMCKKPVITITNGVVEITCPTIGAEIVSNISYGGGNIAGGKSKIVLAGTTVCHIEAYATKEDYVDSDVTTADVELSVGKKGDVNQDGAVSISDAVGVVNIILNEGE